MKTKKTNTGNSRYSHSSIPRENIWFFTEGTIIDESSDQKTKVSNEESKNLPTGKLKINKPVNNQQKKETPFVVDWQISGMF